MAPKKDAIDRCGGPALADLPAAGLASLDAPALWAALVFGALAADAAGADSVNKQLRGRGALTKGGERGTDQEDWGMG